VQRLLFDQVFDNCGACAGGLGNVLAEGFAFAAQTVTAGMAGSLVRVDLDAGVRRDFLLPWELMVISAPLGQPKGHVLTSQTVALPANTGDDWVSFDLSTPVALDVGDKFAIALHPVGITGNPGLFAGVWSGGTGNPYAGGRLFYGTASNSIFTPESVDPLCSPGCQGWDLFFRTYVDTNTTAAPEPSAGWLFTIGVTLIVVARSLARFGNGLRRSGVIGNERGQSSLALYLSRIRSSAAGKESGTTRRGVLLPRKGLRHGSHPSSAPVARFSAALLVVVGSNAWAGNIATDSAAKLIQGTNASVRYQLYQSSGTAAPQKVDAFMAPVLGAIKNGITTGLDPFTLGILKDQALNYAVTTASKMTPEQAMNAGFSFLGDAVPLLFGGPETLAAKIALSKMGLDFIKMNLTAYMNPAASGQGVSRGIIVFAVQPPNVSRWISPA
jgi:hypothetical protein